MLWIFKHEKFIKKIIHVHIKNIDYKISEEIIKINSGTFFSDPDVERHIASSMVLDLLSSMQPPVGKNHAFKK